jgi:hypothetical protein
MRVCSEAQDQWEGIRYRVFNGEQYPTLAFYCADFEFSAWSAPSPQQMITFQLDADQRESQPEFCGYRTTMMRGLLRVLNEPEGALKDSFFANY